MKKRFLATMLSVVMAASLATGCGGGSASAPAGTTGGGTEAGGETTAAQVQNQAEASGEQVTLTIMDGYAPEDPHGQFIY